MTCKYHGTPLTPRRHFETLGGYNFVVPFIRPESIKPILELNAARQIMLDSGAFSVWRRGGSIEWPSYYKWAEGILSRHDGAWAVIGDVIDGTEADNDKLIAEWPHGCKGAPVWHLHESIEKLQFLCFVWPRVCIGSSGAYATIGTKAWITRMNEAMDSIANSDGTMPCKIHMLRGLKLVQAPWPYPFDSVDSATVARNFRTRGKTPLELIQAWERHDCPTRWIGA